MRKLLLLLLAVVTGGTTAWADDYVELLTNGACNGTFDGWTVVNGGNGWAIDYDHYCWVSSNAKCTLSQLIDLNEKGLTNETIDGGNVKCKASAQMKSWWNSNGRGARVAMVKVQAQDSNGSVLSTEYVLDNVMYVEDWSTSEIEFNLPSGTRKLLYIVEGQDYVIWAGNYGPAFRNLSLKVQGANGGSDQQNELVFLKYIKSTGQQAFNTHYTHKANTIVEMDCSVEQDHGSNWEALFGARLSNYKNNAFCFFSRCDGNDIPCFNRSGNEMRGEGFVYGERITLLCSFKNAIWYRHNATEEAGSVSTSGTVDDGKTPMLLFNLNTASSEGGVQIDTSPSCMTLYSCKIYESYGDVIHEFVPAKKNGVVGLYDKITGSFSGSITGTSFEAGPEKVTPSYNVNVQVVSGEGHVDAPATAKVDEVVNVTATPNDGYKFQSITVRDADGNPRYYEMKSTDGTEYVFAFSMPANDVTVMVAFEQDDSSDVPSPLPYIRSTGLQAFNTGYIHKSNTKVVMDCEVKQNADRNWEALFGARLSSYRNNAFCFFSRTDGRDIPCFNRSGNEPRGEGFVYDERITLVAYNKTATWYMGNDLETPAGSVTTTGTADDGKTPMLLFDLNTSNAEGDVQEDGSKSLMKLYGCEIYEGEDLIHHFTPAQKNGVVGLYDEVTGSFAGSMTATPFIAGSDTDDPAYPITLNYGAEGRVELDKVEARESETVEVEIYPNDGYIFGSIEVKDADGNLVTTTLKDKDGTKRSFTFRMPAKSVTVTVTFGEDQSSNIIRTIPDGCEIKEYYRGSHSIYHNGSYYIDRTDGYLTVAFAPTGNKVYIKYPFRYYSDINNKETHWVEGTYNKSTGIISVPVGQGLSWNVEQQCGLILCWGSTSIIKDGDDYLLQPEVDNSVTSIQFKVDGNNLYLLNAVSHIDQDFPLNFISTGIMAIRTDDNTLHCNEFPALGRNGKNLPFASILSEGSLVPEDPSIDSWYDSGDDYGYTRLYFTLPNRSVGEMLLNPKYLSYSVYLDNGNGPELFTFDAGTYYHDITEDITEVPYSLYNNGYDFKPQYCYFYRTNVEGYEPLFTKNIGLRVYYTASGIRHSSNIVWLYKVDDPDDISEIGQQTTDGQQTIYNLAGQRLEKLQKGINIINGRKVVTK